MKTLIQTEQVVNILFKVQGSVNASASLYNASVNTFTSAVLPFDKLIRRIKAWLGVRRSTPAWEVGLILRPGTPRLCTISRMASTAMMPFCTPDTWRTAFRHVCSRSVRLTVQTKVYGCICCRRSHSKLHVTGTEGKALGVPPAARSASSCRALALMVLIMFAKYKGRCVCGVRVRARRRYTTHTRARTHTHTHTHARTHTRAQNTHTHLMAAADRFTRAHTRAHTHTHT